MKEETAAGAFEAPPAKAAPSDRTAKRGALLQAAASLVWLPQAALIAFAVQAMASAGGTRSILLAAGGVLVLGVLRALLDAWGSRLAYGSARAALTKLRAEAAAALVARSPLDAERPPAGLAASVMAEQAEAVVPYLFRFRPARMKATLVPLAILVVVLPLSWIAALVLLVAAPLIPVFMALVGWRAKAASEEQMIETGGMNAFLLDRLRGLSTIRALGAVEPTADRLRESALALKRKTMAVLRIAFLSSAVLELFSALGVAMVAVYVGFHLLGQIPFGAWGGKLSLGEGLFILLLAPAFFEPLRELSAVWHDRAAGEAGLAAVRNLAAPGLPLPGGDAPAPFRPRIVPRAPDVRIRALAFRHGGAETPVFERFALSVGAGERIAILGPSGSGKSTLLGLIAGLAPVAEGTIEIDGQLLDAAGAPGLRRRMAWIGQKPHFFAGTLTANITLGRTGIGPADAERALGFAALDRVAALHPGRIGEGGAGLSGGEALRLALARAAADPSADLILADEPTAHLDSETAAAVTEGLLALAAGRTLIVATHDPVLAARMDRVVRLGGEREARP